LTDIGAMLHLAINDFLLNTECTALADDTVASKLSVLKDLKRRASGILTDHSTILNSHSNLQDELESMHQDIQRRRNEYASLNIEMQRELYRDLDFKIKLLKMAQFIEQLGQQSKLLSAEQDLYITDNRVESMSDYTDSQIESFNISIIPHIVLNVLKHLPHKALPTRSKLFQCLLHNTHALKKSLLSKFHEQFEMLLEDHEDTSINVSARSDGHKQHLKLSWSQFLEHAREWLLAYAMVSLLPKLLSESDNMIIEGYQSVLDEALMPLWGRFRFHLSFAVECGSKKQILWTFHYVRSFTELLTVLCQHLAEAKEVEAMFRLKTASSAIVHAHIDGSNDNDNDNDDGDDAAANDDDDDDSKGEKIFLTLFQRYKMAGHAYISNKCLSFCRAHLANVLYSIQQVKDTLPTGGIISNNPNKHIEKSSILGSTDGDSSINAFIMVVIERTLGLEHFFVNILTKGAQLSIKPPSYVDDHTVASNHDQNNHNDNDDDDRLTAALLAATHTEFGSEDKLIDIICDMADIFHQWIRRDVSFVVEKLTFYVKDFNEIYVNAFTQDINEDANNIHYKHGTPGAGECMNSGGYVINIDNTVDRTDRENEIHSIATLSTYPSSIVRHQENMRRAIQEKAMHYYHSLLQIDGKRLFVDNNYTSISMYSDLSRIAEISNSQTQIDALSVSRSYFCYKGLYHTLSLFLTCTQRYTVLSAHHQDNFSRHVLEPLLILCLAQLLVGIRSDIVLCDLSRGLLPVNMMDELRAFRRKNSTGNDHNEHVTGDNGMHFLHKFASLFRLQQSILYLKHVLSTATIKVVYCNTDRFDHLWAEIHTWLPTDIAYQSATQQTHIYTTLYTKLIDKLFVSVEHDNEEDAAEGEEEEGGGAGGVNVKKDVKVAYREAVQVGENQGEAVELIICQAEKMLNVLERQFKKCLSKA
jgi:hypothetical protein